MELQKIHKDSYDHFTNQAMEEILTDFFAQLPKKLPDDNGIKLAFTGIQFQPNKYEEYCQEHGDIYDEQFCRERKLTFSEMAKISYTIDDDGQSEEETVQWELPRMTENEYFVINGTDLYLIPQLVPSPGFFCYPAGREIVASIRPESGYEIELVCAYRTSKEPPQKRITREITFKKVGTNKTLLSLPVDEFLDAIGIATDERQVIFSDEKRKRQKTVDKVYKTLFPDKKKSKFDTNEKIRQIREQVEAWLQSSELTRLGRWQVNRRLNQLDDAAKEGIPNIDYQDKDDYIEQSIETRLTLPDVLGAIRYFDKALEGDIDLDELEHLDNQKVVRVGDYLEEQLNNRLSRITDAFAKKEDVSKTAISEFLNKRLNAINLPQMMILPHNPTGSCRYLFHTNALYDATEKRRITKRGWRGVQGNEFYIPQKRDIHWSYYGRICPVDTPQSDQVGLTLSLAIYAQVDALGRVKTPYWKVINGKVSNQIDWLLASEEENLKNNNGKPKWIAYADQVTADKQLKDTVQARRGSKELEKKSKDEIAYIDIGAEQPFSLAANLIPFLRHDDPNRALMACSAMKQALPLKHPEKPLILTGFEAIAVRESNQATFALQDGKIDVIVGESIKIDSGMSYSIDQNLPTLAKTVRNHRVAVKDGKPLAAGDSIRAGNLLADCATSENGQLALGKNLLVAFMPWFGWNFEDAIVISDQLQKEDVLTSIHCYEHEYVVKREIYLADEAKLKEVLRKRLRAALNEDIQKKTKEKGEKAARSWFNMRFSRLCQSREIIYRSLVEDQSEVNEPIPFVEVVYRRKPKSRTQQHDIPDEIALPKLDSKPPIGISGTVDVKIYDNPAELSSNVKQIFRFRIRYERPISVGDKLSNRHGNKGVVSRILPQAKMPFFYMKDGNGKRFRRYVDVLLNPLGIPSRQNLGQLYETHFGWIAKKGGGDGFETPFISPYNQNRLVELSQADDTLKDGKVELHYMDEKSQTQKIETPITVGYMYLMKLNHNAADKINVRSDAGYSQTTEQPLKGRRLRGGQRLGEMEVWALWGHNVPSLLYEMLCVKSDDALGKEKLQARPPQLDETFFINHNNFPESIRMFIFFLRSLGLSPIFTKDGEDVTDEILKHIGLMDTSDCIEGAKLDFNQITLKIATPEEIERWAFSKVIDGTSALDDEYAFRLTTKQEEERVFRYLTKLGRQKSPDIQCIAPEFQSSFDVLSQKKLLNIPLAKLNQRDRFRVDSTFQTHLEFRHDISKVKQAFENHGIQLSDSIAIQNRDSELSEANSNKTGWLITDTDSGQTYTVSQGVGSLIFYKGNTEMLECLAQLKNLGFRVATEHGCTYSIWDLWEIAMERQTVERMGSEEQIDKEIKVTLEEKDNSVAEIFLSGARGNPKQMRKMVGGVWEIESIDPKREPKIIRSNLTHGLSVGEYVYSVYEGRKTQVEQQLATPRAGWLTRKLIYATQRLSIAEDDCGTEQCLSIPKKSIKEYNLIGRWYNTAEGKFKEITADELNLIQNSGEEIISIRSPIFCQSKKGICRTCYGWDLSTRAPVETATPVGVIASQSIGERATQASLSARHGGGVENDLESIIKFFNGESPDIFSALDKLKEGIDVGAVAVDLLDAIFGKFVGKVDIKHFEVVLRLMLQQAIEQRTILGLTKIIRSGPGWLANLAFDKPFSALRNTAIEQEVDDLGGALENLLVSHFK